MKDNVGSKAEEYKNLISGVYFEKTIIEAVRRYLAVQNRVGLPLPIFVLVTLAGVRDFTMFTGMRGVVASPIGLDVLPLPEVLVENYGADVPTVLRPMFDALWQACGMEQA